MVKTKTNASAVKALEVRGWAGVGKMVEDLVEAGLLEADPDVRSVPEQLADAARSWVGTSPSSSGAKHIFDCASGWSTAGWQYVAKQEGIEIKFEHYPENLRLIFDALVLLAKDAGRTL